MEATTHTTAARVQHVIAECLGLEIHRVHLNASLQQDLGADSIELMDLMLQLEDAFNVDIPDDAFARLITVQAVIDFIEKQ